EDSPCWATPVFPAEDRIRDGHVTGAQTWALPILTHGRSREEALMYLAQAGGDTDTNAAVAGALLGARHGEVALPPRWVDQITGVQGIAQLAERLVSAR